MFYQDSSKSRLCFCTQLNEYGHVRGKGKEWFVIVFVNLVKLASFWHKSPLCNWNTDLLLLNLEINISEYSFVFMTNTGTRTTRVRHWGEFTWEISLHNGVKFLWKTLKGLKHAVYAYHRYRNYPGTASLLLTPTIVLFLVEFAKQYHVLQHK